MSCHLCHAPAVSMITTPVYHYIPVCRACEGCALICWPNMMIDPLPKKES